jgi:hypothetical protein
VVGDSKESDVEVIEIFEEYFEEDDESEEDWSILYNGLGAGEDFSNI